MISSFTLFSQTLYTISFNDIIVQLLLYQLRKDGVYKLLCRLINMNHPYLFMKCQNFNAMNEMYSEGTQKGKFIFIENTFGNILLYSPQ